MTTVLASLCLAGSALAAGPISGGSATVTQNPLDPSSVSVDWSVDMSASGDQVSAYVWVLPAWDDSCTVSPFPYEDSVPDPAYSIAQHTGLTGSTHHEGSESFSISPNIAYCIGASYASNGFYLAEAKWVKYNTPYAEGNGGADLHPYSIDVPLTIHPRGLPTTWNITYFKMVDTADCSSPDAGDLATALNTPEQTISDDLWGSHQVTGELTGLTKESDYCVRVNNSNAAGPETDSDHFWTYSTIGLPPTITNESYTAGSNSIGFELDLTPNVPDGMYSALLSFQYFVKTGDDCSPLVDPSGYLNYDYVWLPYDSGYNPIAVSDMILNLTAGSTYCIRALSNSPNGNSEPGDFQEVKLIQKQPVSAGLAVGPSDNDADAALNVTLDDHGAADDAGSPSQYYVDVYGISPDRCNTEDYHGSSDNPLSTSEYDFSGSVELSFDISGIVYDTDYCAVVHTESAWGADYNTITYLPFKGGKKPTFLEVGSTKTTDSITVNASINPGNFATEYNANYFAADGENSCDSYSGSVSTTTGATTDANISAATEVSRTITGLEPGTAYCVNFAAGNVWGAVFSDWQRITTDALTPPDTTPPTVPTGLSASSVTKTSATLSWSSSTDDTAVAGYNIYKEGSPYLDATQTSVTVTLVCGQTSHFRVSAFDGATPANESAKSDEFAITGAACDDGAGGGTQPPPTDTNRVCFKPIASKSKLKTSKKSIKLTIKSSVAADGQSIKVTAAGAKTKITFKVNGKAVKSSKSNAITVAMADKATKVTVKFALGRKSKTITLALGVRPCPLPTQ